MKRSLLLLSILLFGSILSGCGKEKAASDNLPVVQETDKLQIKTIKKGKGEIATKGSFVVVHYTGAFTDGTKFDSSLDRGKPFNFTLGGGQVIAGWDQGVEGMQVGEVRRLIIPPRLGYGPNDFGPIPGNSTLVFEVELLEIKKNPVPQTQAGK
ncbi:FKBP-type peptidyl-prolyl cis-trans isomerase [Candidatus Gracilibacteria bacterium]|nr:FKBP-type peptidyl-prolyl cis-trans isomerase [Candidatus Gracilibacteria bacterium]